MLQASTPYSPTMTRGAVHSLRVQLLFVLMLGVLVPTGALALLLGWTTLHNAGLLSSITAAACCAIATQLFFRRIARFPGVAAATYVLPVLGIAYGSVYTAFSMARIAYANSVLVSCFVMTALAMFIVAGLTWRKGYREIWVVPGGRVSQIRSIPNLSVHDLRSDEWQGEDSVVLVADLHHDLPPGWERFLAEAAINGVPVYHYKHVAEAATGMVQIDSLAENSFGSLIPSLEYRKIKRGADLLGAIIALPILLPLCAVISAAIAVDSRGGVLFRQVRMGYRGRTFQVIKFRTMVCANDGSNASSSLTRADDERITRVGRFLRRTRLDELPQIINILRGEMSWIGPRPEAISLSADYERRIPFYRYRHIVRPGITGWAQVNQGHVTQIDDIDRKLRYDFYYVKNFSYWIDILITVRTIKVILTGFGAK